MATALAAQSLIVPIGTQKFGSLEYTLQLNNAPSDIRDLGNLPIKSVGGATVYIRDVAQVHDGNSPQTNIVHVDGKRSVLMSMLKNGSTSTLAIVDSVRAKLADIKASFPKLLTVTPINDQSLFVRSAISGVAVEGLIAAALTNLMILLFLGSWRSTVIIAVSIPLSILGALIGLAAIGETLNIMTLGGLALAVGILVDDATVTIENINWHLEQGKPVEAAILDGAQQIVTPAFVSLLCICIVFIPMFFLQGVARFLFVPLAEAVMLAMVCSFISSRTLVPTMAQYLLKPHAPHGSQTVVSRNPLVRFQRCFEARFERIRGGYCEVLVMAMGRRRIFVIGFMAFVVASMGLLPFLGSNFFPAVDGGQILLHARVPVGTRVEETAARFAAIEDAIRRVFPADEITTLVDNIGLPNSSINLTYNNTGVIGSADGDVQIALRKDHRPTADYMRELREVLPREFPDTVFNVDIDRTLAQNAGLTARDVTNSLVVNLAGSSQVAPTFWLNPANGIAYPIVLQTPQYKLDSLASLANLPISGAAGSNTQSTQVLGGLSRFSRSSSSAVVSQYDTRTTLSVPALTGAIMCMGAATANSVLVISFARERLAQLAHLPNAGIAAALDAGFVRFRPVLMTALAMVIGMLPMALGLGEGGEQNAPLGRAVIGGLIFATFATLVFVPVVFSLAHAKKPGQCAADASKFIGEPLVA